MNLSNKDLAWAKEVFNKIDNKLSVTSEKSREKIPFSTVDGVHDDSSNAITNWTNGFWGGLMWLMYSQTGKDCYKITARRQQEKLEEGFNRVHKFNHDVGFMFHILHGADYKLTGEEKSKNVNLLSAMILASRYEPLGGFLRCWNGTWRGEDTDGWTIIDSMMNLGLLYWATEITGDNRFKRIATTHADTVMQNHIRDDGAVNHIVVNNPNQFRSVVGVRGGQGYKEGSCWSRGCSWAIYGFVISYLYTGKEEYLETAKKCADYFLKEVEKTNYLPLCDFLAPPEPVYYDTTAGATTACGLIELAKILGDDGEKYLSGAINILKALEKNCNFTLEEDSILQMGMQSYSSGVQKPIIYGDYYFTEAILKLLGNTFMPW